MLSQPDAELTVTMVRKLRLLGALMALMMLFSLSPRPLPHLVAQAAPLCRTVANHQVCILKITRSAKYYWEYRAVVQVDDKRRPMARYNCRTRDYVRRDGKHIPDDLAIQVICAFFKQ
ncbi:MAG: hypothetical protein AAGF93_12480 [Cyanobacteria bacterium P01_H01_bin.105]